MPKLTAWLGGGIGLPEQHWQQIPIRPWGRSAAGRMLCLKASSSHAGVRNLRGSLRQELLAPAGRVGLREEGQGQWEHLTPSRQLVPLCGCWAWSSWTRWRGQQGMFSKEWFSLGKKQGKAIPYSLFPVLWCTNALSSWKQPGAVAISTQS